MKYLISLIGWFFLTISTLPILYAFYVILKLSKTNSLNLIFPTGNFLSQIEFIYNALIVIFCLILGIGIVRFKYIILKFVVILCALNICFQLFMFSVNFTNWDHSDLSILIIDLCLSIFLLVFFTRNSVKDHFRH